MTEFEYKAFVMGQISCEDSYIYKDISFENPYNKGIEKDLFEFWNRGWNQFMTNKEIDYDK